MTVTYLSETAMQAGFDTRILAMDQIGWNAQAGFVDHEDRPIRSIFKLYPWEWMVHEAFGGHVLDARQGITWIEPIWKMLWSNKGLLAILWDLFPGHRNLLPARLHDPAGMTTHVRKPLFSARALTLPWSRRPARP